MRALALLGQSAEPRAGNQRFAIEAGQVYLLGELRADDGLLAPPGEFRRQVGGNVDPLLVLSREEIGGVLAETGYPWSVLEDAPDGWHAVASDPRGCRCELVAKPIPGGIEVEAVLAEWQHGLSEQSQHALARFLIAAHGRVRFARFILQSRRVSAVSFAAAARLETELADSVFAVVAACGLAWREVAALATDQVAQAYLETID